MPCANVHMLLSRRVLERWEHEPSSAPFPPGDAGCRTAFLHGTMAPDVGYMPGNDRFVSDLAHFWESGGLVRDLLRRAEDDGQVAFAWGWATHLVGDAQIHPLVGRRCGELIHGDRSRRLDAMEDEATHVGVEVGLDAAVLEHEEGRLPRPPGRAWLDERGATFLRAALERTYRIDFDTEDILSAHRRGTRIGRRWPALVRVLGSTGKVRGGEGRSRRGALGRAFRAVGGTVAGGMAGAARLFTASGSAAEGLLRPLPPAEWLVEEVYRIAEGFPELVQGHVATNLAELENRNLETGLLQGAVEHPASERTLERLRELGGALAEEESGRRRAPGPAPRSG